MAQLSTRPWLTLRCCVETLQREMCEIWINLVFLRAKGRITPIVVHYIVCMPILSQFLQKGHDFLLNINDIIPLWSCWFFALLVWYWEVAVLFLSLTQQTQSQCVSQIMWEELVSVCFLWGRPVCPFLLCRRQLSLFVLISTVFAKELLLFFSPWDGSSCVFLCVAGTDNPSRQPFYKTFKTSSLYCIHKGSVFLLVYFIYFISLYYLYLFLY